MEWKPKMGEANGYSGEKDPTIPTRKEVIVALKEGVEDNPRARDVIMRWTQAGEERRDRGETTEGRITREWIELLLEAGLHREAVERAKEIVDQFGLPLEVGEDSGKGVAPEGNELYWFCVEVIRKLAS